MIHTGSGWPRARDEREPMCRTGSERRVNPSAGPRARPLPHGEDEGVWGWGRDARIQTGLCAASRRCQSMTPVPLCLLVPRGTRGGWPEWLGGWWGLGDPRGLSWCSPTPVQAIQDRQIWVLSGLNALLGSVAEGSCGAGTRQGTPGASSSLLFSGLGSFPSPGHCSP